LVGGAGGARRFDLSKSAPDAVNTVSGRIRGVATPGTGGMDAELTGNPMSPADIKGWKDMLEGRKRLADEAKRAGEERTRANEAAARAELELEEITLREMAEGRAHADKITLENEKQFLEDREKMWQQVYETIDREQEQAIEDGQALLDNLKDKTDDSADAARELGMTFVSAFERAVIEGEKFSDGLIALGRDIERILLRKMVSEPLAEGMSSIFKGGAGSVFSGIGDWIKGLFGGFKAEGGPLDSGKWYIAGEHGPEPVWGGGAGAFAMGYGGGGGGGSSVVVNVINNSGAQVRTAQREDAGRLTMDVIVEQVEQKQAERIRRGAGLAPALERQYGLSRVPGSSR
jgi:hypothetical protein